LNYVTREPSYEELWDEKLNDSQRRRALQDWSKIKEWVSNLNDRGIIPSSSEIDDKLRRFMDDLRNRHRVPEPFLVTFYMATRVDPLPSTEQSDQLLVRLIDTMSVLSLFKECRFYSNHLDTSGYGGPPRTLWESDRNLDSGEARLEYARFQLKVRRLL